MLRAWFAPTINGAKIGVMTTKDADISATTSAGVATVTQQQSNKLVVSAEHLGVGLVTITGLESFQTAQVVIQQSGENPVVLNIRSLPGDGDNFSFILSTCDFLRSQWSGNSWQAIRQQIKSPYPLLFRIHPDDVTYVDTMFVDDDVYVSTNEPCISRSEDDYYLAYGAWLGMFDTWFTGHNEDRQWCYQNLGVYASPGDHAFTDDYRRTNSHPVDPALEASATNVWDNIFGMTNPDELTTGDDMAFGFTAGICSFVFSEMQHTCMPYNGSNTTFACYGGQQITAWNNFFNANKKQFNFLCMERFADAGGQGWNEYHSTEAGGWKAAVSSNDNLNGVDGNLTLFTGDRHAQIVVAHDMFWEFLPGQIHGQASVGTNLLQTTFNWGGVIKHAITTRESNGDRPLEGFMLVNVHATAETPYLEIIPYQTWQGELADPGYKWVLYAGSDNNQWQLRHATKGANGSAIV